jgi:hypothetical protein
MSSYIPEHLPVCCTVLSESRCALWLRYVDLIVSIDVSVECAVVALYSVVKQRAG